MNAFDESSNIYQTFAPLYYLLKVFGLISFSFKGPIKNGTFKSTFMDKFYPMIIFVIHLLGIIYQIVTSFRRGFLQNFISIAIFVNITTSLISVFGLYMGRQNLIRFLRVIDCFDRQVKLFSINTCFKNIWSFQLFLINGHSQESSLKRHLYLLFATLTTSVVIAYLSVAINLYVDHHTHFKKLGYMLYIYFYLFLDVMYLMPFIFSCLETSIFCVEWFVEVKH
jgi:hypothetical protein